ncbi:MAG TPA: hypothetical protein VFS00_17695 [Polyangiaceae bacterium]|nr:hypothetical protein [Polyangiaceae bacterium]
MQRLLEIYLEDANAVGGLTPVVYELPWGVAADPAGYQWGDWAFLQRRDGVLPDHFFEKLPASGQQMPVAQHLELSWEGLSQLEAALAEGEGAPVRASFEALVHTLLAGGGRWVVAFWAPSDRDLRVTEGDERAVIDAVVASLRPGGATAGRGWVICGGGAAATSGEGPAANG